MPIPLRADFDAQMVRASARRSKDGPQARRLLALAAILRRREAHRGGEDRRGDASNHSRLGDEVQRPWTGGPDRPQAAWTTIWLNDTHRAALAAIIESGRFRRFMGSCAGGSSIFANGFSRSFASSSPSRR